MRAWFKVLIVLILVTIMSFSSLSTIGECRPIQRQNKGLVPSLNGSPPGWSDDKYISGVKDSYQPDIAIEGNYVHVVWSNQSGNYELFYTRSLDGGHTWEHEKQISNLVTPNAWGLAWTPKIAVNGSNVYVVWREDIDVSPWSYEVWFVASHDFGVTWGNTIRLSDLNGTDSADPDICINGDKLYVVFADGRGGGTCADLFFVSSSDRGNTWSPNRLLTPMDGWSRLAPSISSNGSQLHIVWMDSRDYGISSSLHEIYYKSSPDGGATWTSDKRLTAIDNIWSFNPRIVVDASKLHITWEDGRYGNWEIMYKNSTDGGLTWSNDVLISGDDLYQSTWPCISVRNQSVWIAWSDPRDNYGFAGATEIYISNSINGGTTWNSPTRLTYALNYSGQPSIALGNGSTHVVWYDNRTGSGVTDTRIYYKRFPDFPSDTTPPSVTYLSPSTPPNNSTLTPNQKAIVRVHYYDNESACTNASLFWKNTAESNWHWKLMTNISFWNGSYNNYFDANFTESSGTTVTYYVNCTSSANLTTMAPRRTLNFLAGAAVDPYPIYGYAYLYNGNAGAYAPVALANAPVRVTWWNTTTNAWSTINTVTNALGQYSVDLLNYSNYGVVLCNATAPGPYNNLGYNWTIVNITGAPGGRQQDIVCGVPYDVVTTSCPASVVVNTPFSVTYEIRDRDGLRCRGYYTFGDGPMNWRSAGAFTPPPNQWFNGTASPTPGTFTANHVLGLPLGARWLNISEGGAAELNPYLTPWGAFNLYNGQSGYLKDWAIATINVTGQGFLWRLVHGWNLVCVPASPVNKGGNGAFGSFDALNISFAVTGDAGMKVATRNLGTNPSTYAEFVFGAPEAGEFPMDDVHGYWLYLRLPGPFVVNVTALNYSAAGSNVVNLQVGWNLLGFTHNISSGGSQGGGWHNILRAQAFTNGSIAVGLNVPPRIKLVVTWWNAVPQWYNSYVVTPTFPGMASHNWNYDTTYAYGYWVWTDAAILVTFDTGY